MHDEWEYIGSVHHDFLLDIITDRFSETVEHHGWNCVKYHCFMVHPNESSGHVKGNARHREVILMHE